MRSPAAILAVTSGLSLLLGCDERREKTVVIAPRPTERVIIDRNRPVIVARPAPPPPVVVQRPPRTVIVERPRPAPVVVERERGRAVARDRDKRPKKPANEARQ